MWSRRQFLTALATSSSAAVVGSWTGACGTSPRRQSLKSGTPIADQDYRLAYETIAGALQGAFVWSKNETVHSRSIDPDEKRSDFSEILQIALGGRIGASQHEISLTNPTPEELVASSRRLASLAGAQSGEGVPLKKQAPRYGEVIPSEVGDFESLATLYKRSEAISDSRIVFRNAYSRVSHVRTISLAKGLHRENSQSRAIEGILFATWTGKDIATSTAESTTVLPTMQPVSDDRLRAAAQKALAPLHARPATLQGTHTIILSPEVNACLLQRLFTDKCPRTNSTRFIATDKLTIEDRPSLVGYTNFLYDDLGELASNKLLVGAKISTIGQGNWHRDNQGRRRCVARNLRLQASEATTRPNLAQVLSGVEKGVVVDGPLHASLDSEGQRFILRTNIAYEVRSGNTTGRVLGPMSIRADVDQFIAQTQAIGGAEEAYVSEYRGIPISVQSPYWRSLAHVEHG